ncbi:MAG: type II secretion system protein [Candidatus Omnitrophota bacterium]
MFRRKGFTIIELLIVIAVIAILVGIALPRFKGMRDEGNITRAKSELRTLQTAVESYYVHNTSTYPANLNLLITATPTIVGVVPTDPFNGTNVYGYALDGGSPANYYVLYSIGPGGNGSATVSNVGVVTETNPASCIYVTNGTATDTQP